MNWIVALVAVVAAADLPQRVRQLRDYPPAQRVVVGCGVVGAAVAIAAIASPLLDVLDVSGPTLEVGAGMVLILWSVAAFFRWTDEVAPPGVAAGLIPGLFPIVLTPAVGIVLWAVGTRNGYPVAIAAGVLVGAAIAAPPAFAQAIGRRPVRRASATVGVVIGIVMMTDGVLAV